MTTENSLVTGQDTPNAGVQQQTADGVMPDAQGAAPDGAVSPEGVTPPADGAAPDANANAEDNKDDGAKAPEVPESYEFTMPDGVQMDTAAAEELGSIAKELKLSQADAQKFADVGAKMVQRQAEAHQELVQSWVDAVKTDKEIGGDKLAENLALARKTIDTFGTPELKAILNKSGMGNHPEIVKLAFKVGKAISDDGFVRGGNTTPQLSAAEILYPSMAKK